MPSFDTVLEADLVKVKNAVENSAKEIGTRFDFKGTSASIELKDKEITSIGDSDFQIDQINDILRSKLTKAGVDVRFLELGKVEKIGGDKVRQTSKVRNGISTEDGKKIQHSFDPKVYVPANQKRNASVRGIEKKNLKNFGFTCRCMRQDPQAVCENPYK